MDLYLERLNPRTAPRRCTTAPGSPSRCTARRSSVRGRAEPEVRRGPPRPVTARSSTPTWLGSPTRPRTPLAETYALQWVGRRTRASRSSHGPGHQPGPGLRRVPRAALRGWECPGQNMVYADVDGNIGYQLTGACAPSAAAATARTPSPDGRASTGGTAGSRSRSSRGRTTRRRASWPRPTTGPTTLAYPYVITRDWMPSGRVRRIVELLTETRDAHPGVVRPDPDGHGVAHRAGDRCRGSSSSSPPTTGRRRPSRCSPSGTTTWRRTRPRRPSTRCGAATSRAWSCAPGSARSSSRTTTAAGTGRTRSATRSCPRSSTYPTAQLVGGRRDARRATRCSPRPSTAPWTS